MANVDSHLNRLTPDYGLALLQTVSQNVLKICELPFLDTWHVAQRFKSKLG
jgi:hypothetical protein